MPKVRKQTEASVPPEAAAAAPPTLEQRAALVLVSQGRAPGMLASLGEKRIAQLAAFTAEDGTVLPSIELPAPEGDELEGQNITVPVGVGVQNVLLDFWNEQKAVVDEPPSPPAS